ncbi:glycosyltransferase family 4 protein [Nitrosospira sp. Nsp13]|uniref:glycosyltransferase family 4 protein n=1 Tax=Nitrosospira sp. Nsp13 TaxID=1855332 RepID=UPI0008916287|nr:glycosyltransferase family 4 protein [Nitrosospira sp. Nsp13]SCY24568.1 Glycosyltransferase involved in cell wall bisynthesis [Nitrosospira sp. Nsp13]
MASGMRIGLVGPLPPPSGGMANQTLQLAKLLRAEGATVEVVQVNRPYRPHWVGGLKGIRAAFRLIPYLAHLWQSAANVRLFHVMANSGWSWHLFAAPAIWIARIRGIPVIVNYRGGEADAFFDKSFAWIKPSLRRTDAIIVPSGFLETVFGKRGFQTRIVPNIIDLSRFSAETGMAALLRTDAPHIIVTRNLELIYDNATVLRAFSIVRQTFSTATLTIAGTGPERQALEKLAAELGMADAITFTGRIDNEGMADLYRSADIMVNPSLADNMPISILEALASGVPVVSTDVGGVPYLVEHGETALLVPVKDPVAMAGAILTLLNEPARARKIREAGIASVQQYTWPNVRDRLLAVYEHVLAKTNKPLVDGEG